MQLQSNKFILTTAILSKVYLHSANPRTTPYVAVILTYLTK